jgi:exosortase
MQSGSVVGQTMGFIRRQKLFLVLAAIHLPFVAEYWTTLWRLPHYQFFPFALVAFGCLLVTRGSQEKRRWTFLASLLMGADLLCFSAGVLLNSPWLFAVGLLCCCTACCLNVRDEGFERSLFYLSMLPALTIRLPLNTDENVIHWLQRVTTAAASAILNQLHLLHLREGNVLHFPGKSFLIAEACSGVQSLFAILFIGAMVACLQRRPFIHAGLLLCSGVVFAGVMNVARVLTIAIAWQTRQVDLSEGTVHEILGYCCLILAALLLMSMDHFLRIILSPVPDIHADGAAGWFRNPLTFVWNELLLVKPVEDEANALSKNTTPNPS